MFHTFINSQNITVSKGATFYIDPSAKVYADSIIQNQANDGANDKKQNRKSLVFSKKNTKQIPKKDFSQNTEKKSTVKIIPFGSDTHFIDGKSSSSIAVSENNVTTCIKPDSCELLNKNLKFYDDLKNTYKSDDDKISETHNAHRQRPPPMVYNYNNTNA